MKKFVKILIRIFLIVCVILLLWSIIHRILIKVEKSELEQVGQYVTVKDKKMNVYSLGQGDATIVMMPGLGTTAPILDFEPLAIELAKNYRVVIVEPFGYGWSDWTKEERSVENIIEELKTALCKSGENGPFVLMPHSISGIYAIWYANTYPDEVQAIIGIDCALPRQVEYFGGSNPKVPQIAKIVNSMGLQRIACMLSPTMFISDDKEGIYTNANLEKQIMISNSVGYNYTVIDETNAVEQNIKNTIDMEFSKDLPVLFFTRENRKDFYETYISNPELQKVVVLDSGHYMHWTKTFEISQTIKNVGIFD